jgi:serine protease Do
MLKEARFPLDIGNSLLDIHQFGLVLSPMMLRNTTVRLLLILFLATVAAPFAGAQDRTALEQAAIRAAVARVAPSVVQIETIGGIERVEKLLFGTGPTTGLIVDAQGYIVSSAFNFVNRPASILVRLADGTRRPARLVATDRSRMLVLLKIDAPQPLPVPAVAPQAGMRVGQWTIAVGRAFDVAQPNLAVGILSAVGRIWQRAIQTSAGVSPNNYGGPLVDIEGRVIGVLVPLSPESESELAGVNWYDSGIGFAIPAEHVMRMLPRLKKGEDLRAGVMGIGFRSRSLYSEPPVLSTTHPRSPADKAGLRQGDRIVEIDGQKIERASQVKEAIMRRYAGDKLHVVALRENKRHEFDVPLVDKLLPYELPVLGALPLRSAVLQAESGVALRWVDPQGPAAKAGLRAGDRLITLQGKPIADRESLVEQLGNLEPDAEAQLQFRRGEQQQTVKLKLGHASEALPPKELPPARTKVAKAESKPTAGTGTVAIKAGELPNEVWAYVPDSYHPSAAQGLLIWLQGADPQEPKELIGRFASICRRHELILVVPKPAQGGAWRSGDAALVAKLVEELQATYTIDPARVVVGGQENGGAVALQAAVRHRALIRGVIAVDVPLLGGVPENEPGQALSFLMIKAGNRLLGTLLAQSVELLRAAKFPVVLKELGKGGVYDSDSLGDMVRWTDMLDRI